MDRLKKEYATFEIIEEWLCIGMMLLMFVAIGCNIVTSWVAHTRLAEFEEIGTAAYMFSCYAAMGWMYKKKDFTEVTFVVNAMRPKMRWFFELFRYLFIVFFCVLLTVRGIELCGNSIQKKLTALQLPYIYLDVCIVFGFFIMGVRSIVDTIKHLIARKSIVIGG